MQLLSKQYHQGNKKSTNNITPSSSTTEKVHNGSVESADKLSLKQKHA